MKEMIQNMGERVPRTLTSSPQSMHSRAVAWTCQCSKSDSKKSEEEILGEEIRTLNEEISKCKEIIAQKKIKLKPWIRDRDILEKRMRDILEKRCSCEKKMGDIQREIDFEENCLKEREKLIAAHWEDWKKRCGELQAKMTRKYHPFEEKGIEILQGDIKRKSEDMILNGLQMFHQAIKLRTMALRLNPSLSPEHKLAIETLKGLMQNACSANPTINKDAEKLAEETVKGYRERVRKLFDEKEELTAAKEKMNNDKVELEKFKKDKEIEMEQRRGGIKRFEDEIERIKKGELEEKNKRIEELREEIEQQNAKICANQKRITDIFLLYEDREKS